MKIIEFTGKRKDETGETRNLLEEWEGKILEQLK